MKKSIVLFVLFVLPIVAYLFFASGVNSFTKIPVLTKNIPEFGDWKALKNEKIKLQNKITVLGFGGFDLQKNRGNIFTLNMKVYKRYHEFKDLQFVILCPNGTETDAQRILDAMSKTVSTKQWHFVFTDTLSIKNYYNNLKLKKDKLFPSYGTSNVYLVDKNLDLRGRKVNNLEEYNEGYDTFHPSELSNVMLDDFKILLYEYRAALKKNKNAEKRLELKTK
jgi:hypothetical protein